MKTTLTCGSLSIGLALFLAGLVRAADTPTAAPSTAPSAASESHYDRLIDSLAAQASKGRTHDPLRFLTDDMSDIVGDLSEYKTDAPVQGKQTRVVGRLESLIRELEKQCKGSGGGQNPTSPMADSQIKSGKAGYGQMHDPKQGEGKWGDLPPKLREQILQSKTDGFPAGYESILQSYYQRLSQERVGAEPAPPSPEKAADKAPTP